jgi:hypothetical protein
MLLLLHGIVLLDGVKDPGVKDVVQFVKQLFDRKTLDLLHAVLEGAPKGVQ